MWRIVTLAILCALAPVAAQADAYPSKAIRFVVPYPPGGPTDLVGRLYANKMGEIFGKPVVIENRSGANGNIASQLVAKTAPDGYTILMHSSSFVINPMLYKTPGYDPVTDFTPVGLVFDYKLMVVVHPSFAPTSLKELVAAAKAKPGTITYASAGGVGAPTHLSVEMFKQIAGIDLIHVPYTGGAPAVNDLLGGHVQMMFNNPTQSLPYIKAGKLRALATTGAQRMPQAPDLPTVAELGYPDFDVGTWFGIWAPAGTPKPIVATLSAAIAKVAAMPDVNETLAAQGLNNLAGTTEQAAAFQASETLRWARVIKAAGIVAE